MLYVKNISKSIASRNILRNINFNIKNGQILGILGPNGAGKTTLLRIITGYLSPDTGSVFWDDQSIEKNPANYKKNLAYLPESNLLYPYLTGFEFLKFVADLRLDHREDFRKEIKTIQKTLDLGDILDRKIDTLSKGQKQRLSLASCLIGNPSLLVLDEPSSGLDPNQIISFRSLIKKISKTHTVIFSTHLISEAKELCDQILIINKGQIVFDKPIIGIKNLEKKFIELTEQ